MAELPKVSVAIVSRNNRYRLNNCLKSLRHLNYPKDKLEWIVVDNGSTDGSVELVKEKYGQVRLLRNEQDVGYARACNDAARAADGEKIAFLRTDMKADRNWIMGLVESAGAAGAVCAGSLILNRNGSVAFAGGSVNFLGDDYGWDVNCPSGKIAERLPEDKPLLFASSGAMMIDRNLFLDIGGFDENFYQYGEDIDLGWRLRLFGCQTVLSVGSRVSKTARPEDEEDKQPEKTAFLRQRNKLFTIYKNYGDERFSHVFLSSLLLEIRNTYLESGIDGYTYDSRSPYKVSGKSTRISHAGAARLAALNDLVEHMTDLDAGRRQVQARRVVADEDLRGFFPNPFYVAKSMSTDLFNTEYKLVKLFDIDGTMGVEWRRRILLVSNEIIGQKMAGPGIRYWEMAKCLADTGKFQVVLACPSGCDLSYPGIETLIYTAADYDNLLDAAKQSNIVMVQGFVLSTKPDLAEILDGKYVVVDIYDPFLIENLETFNNKESSMKEHYHEESLKCLEYQLKLGDFFVCANDKQADYWIGMLSAYDRINPKLYERDKSGKQLIDLVPFGISDAEPVHTRNVLKGVWPGIGADDKVLIWGGGVWNWFDPLTVIKAIQRISEKRSDVKLFFMGVRHPNPDVPEMQMLNQAIDLAKDLGVYDRYVFFNFDWVDYNDRQNYLMESDIGVSCHFDTLETRFSFRTRILDYLWAGLPIICTKGDSFAEMVQHSQLGVAVDYNDDDGLAEAVLRLLDSPDRLGACRARVREAAEQFKWSRITEPVIRYCENPVHMGMRNFAAEAAPEKAETGWASRPASGKFEKGAIRDKIIRIEKQQYEMQKLIQNNTRYIMKTARIVSELQKWSYMFNDRFNKMKKLVNPVAVIRHLKNAVGRRK